MQPLLFMKSWNCGAERLPGPILDSPTILSGLTLMIQVYNE